MKKILAIFALLLIGCGYQPSAVVTKSILDESVFVDVVMDKIDPRNTVALKDAVRSGIVERLHRKIADKSSAETYIIAKIKRLKFSALTYDQYGYVTSFNASLTLNFKTKLKNGEVFSADTVGNHDFRVTRLVKKVRDTSAVISDKDRFDAIENASKQAFDEFIAVLAMKGLKTSEKPQ